MKRWISAKVALPGNLFADDRYFWVYINGVVTIAHWDKMMRRFHNGDTWEDFDNEVTHWMLAKVPNKPEKS